MRPDPDAALLARDTRIPDLGLALAGDRLCDSLRRARPDLGVSQVDITYLRYKPGTGCIAGFRATTDAGILSAAVHVVAPAAAAKLAKVEDRARRRPADLAPVRLGPTALVWPLPHDRHLPAARRLGRGPAQQARLLRELLPDLADDHGALAIHDLRYKPGRRWVARVDGPDGPLAVIKCYARPDFAAAGRAARHLPPRSSAPLLQRLGTSARHRALSFPHLSGSSLAFLLDVGGRPDLRPVGAALAALHASAVDGLAVRPPAADVADLLAGVEALRAVLPDVAGRAARVADRVADVIGDPAGTRPTARHGDFSADQVLLRAAGPVILDLDQAAVGDPAADAALFAATELVRSGATGDPARAWTDLEDLLEGYAGAGGPDRLDRIRPWIAAWLVRLAVEPFRHRRDGWAAEAEALVALAEERCR